LAVVDGFCSPQICSGKLMATGGVGLSHPACNGGVVTVAGDADQPELRSAGFAFPDRATFAFLAGFVVADTGSMGAVFEFEPSSDVVRTSR
jgi:hypothetical protein